MPCALSPSLRQQIVTQWAKGSSLIAISELYGLSYSTVRNICHRFQTEGCKGLTPHYFNCGRKGAARGDYRLWRAALWLKRLHPRWGAALILLLLKARYRRAVLPGERTLQRWFHSAGLYKAKSSFPLPLQPWAKRVHDIWQIDAKEKLHLASGQRTCYLTVVDEKSGSLLAAFVFPPFSDQ